MTKKDFKAIAAIIADLPAVIALKDDEHKMIAEIFATYLRTTNPRFDKQRFLSACEWQE